MSDERHDGLSPEERRVGDAVRGMRPVSADPAFRESLKRRFVRGELEEPEIESAARGRRLAWGWLLVPAVVVVLLFFLWPSEPLSWRVLEARGQGRITVDGRVFSPALTGGLDRAVRAGATVEVDDEVLLDLKLGGSLLFELAEGTEVTLPQPLASPSEEPASGVVLAGELRIKTGPDFSGQRLRIVTSESVTDIVGTAVSVFKAADLTCVCVLEGTALIGKDEARMEPVPPGMRKIMFADGRPSMIVELEPKHEHGLVDFLENHRSVFESNE